MKKWSKRDKYSASFSSLEHSITQLHLFQQLLSSDDQSDICSLRETSALKQQEKEEGGGGFTKGNNLTLTALRTYTKIRSTFHHNTTWRHNFLYWSLIVLSLHKFKSKPVWRLLWCCCPLRFFEWLQLQQAKRRAAHLQKHAWHASMFGSTTVPSIG